MKTRSDYDKKNDIFSMNWGEVESSIECCDGQVVLDVDKQRNIVGIEIFDIKKMMRRENENK